MTYFQIEPIVFIKITGVYKIYHELGYLCIIESNSILKYSYKSLKQGTFQMLQHSEFLDYINKFSQRNLNLLNSYQLDTTKKLQLSNK